MRHKTTTANTTLYFRITCFLLLWANASICYATAQNTQVSEQLTEPPIEITDCYWTTTNDCDEDNYASSRWLVVDMTGNTPSGMAYIEVWSGYDGSEGSILFQTNNFSATTPILRRGFWVSRTIGRGYGIITVKIIDATSHIVHDSYVLPGIASFESDEEDLKVTLPYTGWADFTYQDNDNDGYYAYHQLNFNYDACPIEEEIYFRISACKLPIMAGPCWYYTSPDYTLDVFGELLNTRIGGENGELSHGEYQIDMVAYSAATDEQLTNFSMISANKKFETQAEDAAPDVDFSISGVYLSDLQIDKDNDLYSRSRDLYFDSNVSTGTYEVWAKILYKDADKCNYSLYYQTSVFSITGDAEDYKMVTLGVPNEKLDSNIYDFKIELYFGTGKVAEKDRHDDTDLKQQWFETPMQDASFKIENCYWSNTYDYDEDGTPSVGDLKVEFSALNDEDDVYLELWSACGDAVYQVETIETFELSDPGLDTTFIIHHRNNFCGGDLILFRESTGEVEDGWHIGGSPYFESMDKDINYGIESYSWADTVDNDGDGYFSHRSLIVDVDVGPLSGHAVIKLSLCKHPILAGPCWYYTSPAFTVDSAGRADSCVIDIGLPNGELSYGEYQVAYTVNDPLTDEILVGFQYMPTTLFFEPSDEDHSMQIEDCYWSETFNYDGDGRGSVGILTVELSVYEDTDDVYLQLECLSGDTYTGSKTTEIFELSDPGLVYDWTIYHDISFSDGTLLLKRASTDEVIDAWSVGHSVGFESMKDDMNYSIESYCWADTVDNDGDGYFSHRSLIVDVDVGPLSGDAVIKLSLCKHPILADPCWYYTSPVFTVDSAGRADSCVIDIGLPNSELSYGEYQVAYTVNDPITDEMLVGFQYIADSMLLEPAAKDPAVLSNQAISASLIPVNIFPNPAQSELSFDFSETNDDYLKIDIFNPAGTLLIQQEYIRSENRSNQKRIDISTLPAGWYTIRINGNRTQLTRKLIIVR